MKRGKRLTRNQKEIVNSHGYNPTEWMLVADTEFYLYLVHKDNNNKRLIVDNFKRRETQWRKK